MTCSRTVSTHSSVLCLYLAKSRPSCLQSYMYIDDLGFVLICLVMLWRQDRLGIIGINGRSTCESQSHLGAIVRAHSGLRKFTRTDDGRWGIYCSHTWFCLDGKANVFFDLRLGVCWFVVRLCGLVENVYWIRYKERANKKKILCSQKSSKAHCLANWTGYG